MARNRVNSIIEFFFPETAKRENSRRRSKAYRNRKKKKQEEEIVNKLTYAVLDAMRKKLEEEPG